MKRFMVISAIVAVAVLIGLPGEAYTEQMELKVTCHTGPTHLITRSLEMAWSPLEKMTGGKVKVRVFSAGTLAKGRETLDAVIGGAADIGHVSLGYTPGRFPLSSVAEFPGLFAGALIGTQTMNQLRETTPALQKEFDDAGVKCLNLYVNTPYPLMVAKKKIMTVEELKGLRLRTAGGTQTETVKLTGAIPVLMGSGEIYTSLSRGLLDGGPFVLASMPPYRFYEVIKYIVRNLDFGQVNHGLLMNKETWAKLSPELQEMVQHCGNITGFYVSTFYDVDSQLAIPFMASKGVEFYELPAAEIEKYRKVIEPLEEKWLADMKAKGLPGKETLDNLRAIHDKIVVKWK